MRLSTVLTLFLFNSVWWNDCKKTHCITSDDFMRIGCIHLTMNICDDYHKEMFTILLGTRSPIIDCMRSNGHRPTKISINLIHFFSSINRDKGATTNFDTWAWVWECLLFNVSHRKDSTNLIWCDSKSVTYIVHSLNNWKLPYKWVKFRQ